MRVPGRRTTGPGDGSPSEAVNEIVEVDVNSLAGSFSPPRWLRDLGLGSWLVVGVVLVTVGLVWLVAATQEIAIPVILGSVIGAVTGPAVSAMERRGLARALGALITLLAVVVAAVLVLLLVLGGIANEGGSISDLMTQATDEIAGWLKDLGVSEGDVRKELEEAIPGAGSALIQGVGGLLSDLASVAAVAVFTAFTTFFLLKDGPSMRRWIEGHMGIPKDVARLVVDEVLSALRGYFLGVTIVASFNAVVIGLGAWLLGVPLPATIAVVTFVGAFIPYLGAWIAGFFAVGLALSTGDTETAVAMAVIALLANGLLQQIVQPIAYGATLGLNPLVVLIVTIGGGALFGMVGLVLSAPLTAAAANIAGELGRQRAAREADSDAVEEPALPGIPIVEPS